MTLWGLAAGERSEYYASIAVSMSNSWSNLFFGALDPAGTVTLDKIPGSYWIPAAFVKVFGFSTWAVTAPNALATVATVVIVACTFRRHWGSVTGLVAGLVVAVTPIVVAVGRSNQPQSYFVLALALVMDRALAALVNPQRRTLVAAGAWIGVAFHMYMLEAWAVWPALAAAWLLVARPWRTKAVDLLVAGSTSLAVSLVWITLTWLTPTDRRPYIGGTYSNSPWEMVFGYNGLGRFGGSNSENYRSFSPPFAGGPSIGRLFSDAVAGQIAWLLPAAVVSACILWASRRQRPVVAFLAAWLATFAIMLSVVGGIHQFYTAALALPVAGLIALSATTLDARWRPVLAVVSATTAVWVGTKYGSYFVWAPYVQVLAAIIVAVSVLIPDLRTPRRVVTALTLGALLLTPATWSFDARNHTSAINPMAGPRGVGGGPGGGPGGAAASPDVITYLRGHRGNAVYLLATFGAQNAAHYITATGESILPIGGFDGSDPVPTLDRFTELVDAGAIRYVLAPQRDGRGGPQQDSPIADWVTANCVVDTAAPDSVTLYLCQ